MSLTDGEVRERVARIETLLGDVEAMADPAARAVATETIQALLDLYGEGLARVVGHVASTCDAATSERLARACAGDELVSHLLLLHGLHPDDVHDRVERALDAVRPHLASHGGAVELVGIEHGRALVRLTGHCHGCSASELTLRTMVEDAVRAAAPELHGIVRDEGDGAPSEATDAPALVPLRRSQPLVAT